MYAASPCSMPATGKRRKRKKKRRRINKPMNLSLV